MYVYSEGIRFSGNLNIRTQIKKERGKMREMERRKRKHSSPRYIEIIV